MTIDRRFHRLRATAPLRSLFKETRLHLEDLVYPVFVEEGITEPAEIESMPGIRRLPEAGLAAEIQDGVRQGINSFLLFGVSHSKDDEGSDAMADEGLLARMVRVAKQAAPMATIIADVCFCEYTTHGHCGVLKDGCIDNDHTIANLGRQAVVAARAGADAVAPSGMMDNMVSAIRRALDAAGFANIPIISYSSKFASAFYGPFRDASGITLTGDRKAYQGDMANGRIALLESLQDEAEGADALMVKPGLAYLDVIAELRRKTLLPIGAYQVSGEYAMIKLAARHGLVDEQAVVMETLTAFKRAGADFIITYFAKDVRGYLNG